MTELGRTARLDVLVEGYARLPQVAGTVSLVRDGDRTIVVDPGMVRDRDLILRPLRDLGVRLEDVTDIVISHHHPDHTVNIALFPVVPVHDFRWVIENDVIEVRDADGIRLSPSVQLLATPGHTPEDLTTLVGTPDGVAALTHLWWTAQGPDDDPYAADRELLRRQRERVLELATIIVPGHGAPVPSQRLHPAVSISRRVPLMDFEFEGPVVEWRGPAPFYFVRIPEEESADIKFAAKGLEYWGQVPVQVRIGDTEFQTALFPKGGLYLLPLKVAVRASAGVRVGQVLAVALNVGRR